MTTKMKESNVIYKWESNQIQNDHDVDQVFQTIYRYVNQLFGLAKIPLGNAYYKVNVKDSNYLNQIKEATKLARKAEKQPYVKLGVIDDDLYIRVKVGLSKVSKNQDHIDDYKVAHGFKKFNVEKSKQFLE